MGLEKEVQKAMAKAKGSLERIDELAAQVLGHGESIKQVVMAVNGSMGQLNRQLEEYKEMLNAVIGILGPSQVQEEIEANRRDALLKQVEETKASIASALASGDVVQAEKTSEKSFVAGVETKADGTTIPPGWAFVPMGKIEEEYRTQLLGQGVGFKVATKEGGSFELLEIYEAVEKPVPATPADPLPLSPTEAKA